MNKTNLEYFESYGHIDIWKQTDTVSGITTYIFWFLGGEYKDTNPKRIRGMAAKCIKIHNNQRQR